MIGGRCGPSVAVMLAALFIGVPGPVLAMSCPDPWVTPGALVGDTLQVEAGSLEAVSAAFAAILTDHSAEGFTAVLASGSIRLHWEGSGHSRISSRQAAASLRELLRGFEGGEAHVIRAAPVDGSPERGFAEIVWFTRVSGTSQELRRTVFLGLSRSSEEWRVDEVRLLR